MIISNCDGVGSYWESSEVASGGLGLISSWDGKIGLALKSWQGNQSLSQVEWELRVLLSCGRKLKVPLEEQESQDSSRVEVGNCVSSRNAAGVSVHFLNCSGNLGFLSSCGWHLRFPPELPQGTQSTSRSAAGTQCSSGVAVQNAGFHSSHGGELRVLLELGWYSSVPRDL